MDIKDNKNFSWLNDLNSSQKEAVCELNGPLLVLSGAGTGKTTVLTSRLAQLIATKTVNPWNILAVTFTNKAALEMKDRISYLIGPMADQIMLGTFHSLAARILRKHSQLVSLKSDFIIIDEDDQKRLLKQIMENEGIDTKIWVPKALALKINSWKDRAISYENASDTDFNTKNINIVNIYKLYQERLISLNACDFGDLLLHIYNIFNGNPDLLDRYQSLLKWILVDEYQDTNIVQYLWLRLLSKKYQNICCVGDDDQSIYGWRGAEVGNILRFEKDYKEAKVIRLEQNYRSSGHILASASNLISHNQKRLGKTLFTKTGNGDKLLIVGCYDGKEEANYVSSKVEEFLKNRDKLDQMAVLVRAGFQTREFEERFNKIGIPNKVVGTRFYDRQEIKDAIAYLRIINHSYDDLAFERIINTPKRGLGDSTLKLIKLKSRENGFSFYDACLELSNSDQLKPVPKIAILEFINKVQYWYKRKDEINLSELLSGVLSEFGYFNMLENNKSIENFGRLENLNELISSTKDFENLSSYLEHIALITDYNNYDNKSKITIMTLHAAKGLEYDIIFLPGWEEGIFPSYRSLDENGTKGLEEERRLAYVGITRARKRVLISYASSRRIHGHWQSSIPSRFLEELPEENIYVDSTNEIFTNQDYSHEYLDNNITKINDFNLPYFKKNEHAIEHKNIKSYNSHKKKSENKNATIFIVGDRVKHKKFGEGTIKVVGAGGAVDNKIVVIFDNGLNKNIFPNHITKLN